MKPEFVFYLEDLATTYRETRNAYLKAMNELQLATGPYKAMQSAMMTAIIINTKCDA
jgi:hypothetical protein